MKNKLNRPITQKERETLLEIANKNGRHWKSLLAEAWGSGRYFDLQGVTVDNCQHLYNLRNDLGPDWLASLNLDDFAVTATKTPTHSRIGKSQCQWLDKMLRHGGYWFPGCGYQLANPSSTIVICERLVRQGVLRKDSASDNPQPCYRIAIPEEEARALVRKRSQRQQPAPASRRPAPKILEGPLKVVQSGRGAPKICLAKDDRPIATVNAQGATAESRLAIAELLASSTVMANVLYDLVRLEDHRLRGNEMDLRIYRECWESTIGAAREIVAKLPIAGGKQD
jgi:hypothetical protein